MVRGSGCEFFGCGDESPEVGFVVFCEAEADDVLHGFEFVMVFGVGVLAFNGVNEEARDRLTVFGEVADVLSESALERTLEVSQSFSISSQSVSFSVGQCDKDKRSSRIQSVVSAQCG